MIRTMRLHHNFAKLNAVALSTGRPITALALKTTGTGGGNPANVGIVQVGLVTVQPGTPTRGLVGYVNPQMPIPLNATDLHGIDGERVKDVEPFSAWGDVIGRLALHTLTGFSLMAYDIPVVQAQCARYGIDAPKFQSTVDLATILRERAGDHRERTLHEWADQYNVKHDESPNEKHRAALDDAISMLFLTDAIVGLGGDLNLTPAQSVNEMDEPHYSL